MILPSELIFRHAEQRSDGSTNGGRPGTSLVVSGVKNAIFPDVTQSQRAAGVRHRRKTFLHVANDDDLTLVNAYVFVDTRTPGGDSVVIYPGTWTNTQANLTGNEPGYGLGLLDSDVAAGVTEIDVSVEDPALAIFREGMLVRISDQAELLGEGNQEFRRVAGTPTHVGSVATITLDEPLAFAYVAASTKVASVIEAGSIAATCSAVDVVSTAGQYAYSTSPVGLDWLGTVYQSWTLDFVSSTAFTITGDTLGQIGVGNISTVTAPTNPTNGKPYWLLLPAGFSGTFATGNRLTFITYPAMYPIWHDRRVPAGTEPLSANTWAIGVLGETA